MSLVADYGSDSDSDNEIPAKTVESSASIARVTTIHPPRVRSPDSKKSTNSSYPPKKKKKTLHLPPEIQKLLERGRPLNSDDESDTDAKKTTQIKKSTQKSETSNDVLSFLPPPKVKLQVLPSVPQTTTTKKNEIDESQVVQSIPTNHDNNDNFVSTYSFDEDHAAEDYGHGKRGRNNERELERLLQQGKFDAVAGKITEVQAAAPDAWQPPIDSRGYAHDREAKVLASMTGTETEAGYVVSSYRPTRLQRQRHQLNQLTFDAKLREYEILDSKNQMVKSKKDTAAKYGW